MAVTSCIILLLLTCSLVFGGCSNADNTIENHTWKFDNVQGHDGEILACSADSKWVTDTTERIDLSIEIGAGTFIIKDETTEKEYHCSYEMVDSSVKSTIYSIAYGTLNGTASVSKTRYRSNAEVPTLLITISDYNLYFYEMEAA